MVPECRTVWSGLFIGLHFEFKTGPCGPGFWNCLQNRPWSGLDRTVASLLLSHNMAFELGSELGVGACYGVVVDKRTLYSMINNSVRQVGI